MGVRYKPDSILEIRAKEAEQEKIETDKLVQMNDIDAMLVDFEYRLTLMELGIMEDM